MSQNLKYLKRIIDEESTFAIVLNEYCLNKTEIIKVNIAISLLEFFNNGRFVNKNDLVKINDLQYLVAKKNYPHLKGDENE